MMKILYLLPHLWERVAKTSKRRARVSKFKAHECHQLCVSFVLRQAYRNSATMMPSTMEPPSLSCCASTQTDMDFDTTSKLEAELASERLRHLATQEKLADLRRRM